MCPRVFVVPCICCDAALAARRVLTVGDVASVLRLGAPEKRDAVLAVVDAAAWEASAAGRLRAMRQGWMSRVLHFTTVKVGAVRCRTQPALIE